MSAVESAAERPPDGPFETFHPNGEVATRGRYVAGKLDGFVSRFASSEAGATPLRACCVPPGAVELRVEYRAGRFVDESFYDRDGRALLADGSPWPARPFRVPEGARFDEITARYYERYADDGTTFSLRYFGASGTVLEEVDRQEGRLLARRLFGEDGRKLEDFGLDERGQRHGPYSLHFGAERPSPYADERVREERGSFEHGEGTGALVLLDAEGSTLHSVERGTPFASSPLVTGEEPRAASPDQLFLLAAELATGRRTREAVAVAARAGGRSGDAARLSSFVAGCSLPLRPDFARRAAAAPLGTPPSTLLDLALCGADLALVLRTLSATLLPESPAALDYAEASLLLEPGDAFTRMTRALLRLEQGDHETALADADSIEPYSASSAELLRELSRVLRPRFGFEPREDPAEASGEQELPVEFAQPLEAARRAVGLYATRLELVRRAVTVRLGREPAWLPPNVEALMPAGPVELGRYLARIADEEDGTIEVSEVPVDETLDFEHASVRRLMTLARADWAALCWLCWSVGLDEVALPQAIAPREAFAAAANRATLRCFWAHDRLRTDGLVARSREIPPFDWEGLSIRTLPRKLVEVAAAESLEVRALFLWALFPQNVSPFQADLRAV